MASAISSARMTASTIGASRWGLRHRFPSLTDHGFGDDAGRTIKAETAHAIRSKVIDSRFSMCKFASDQSGYDTMSNRPQDHDRVNASGDHDDRSEEHTSE